MATTDAPAPDLALMSALLEDQEPDAYVVISARALQAQIDVAMREEFRETHGKPQWQRLSYRLLRNLQQLGFTKNTKHEVRT